MKTVTENEVNRVLSSYVTTKQMPFGWKGTTLDLLEYSDFPVDARVCAALIIEEDNKQVHEAFAAWCKQELLKIEENEYAKRGLTYAIKWDGKGSVNILASFMRRAYFDDAYNATANTARAVSAAAGAASMQALTLYRLLSEQSKGAK